MSSVQDFTARQLCIYCKGGECADDTAEEDAMVLCECCMDHGAHLKCLRNAGQLNVSPDEVASPSFQWFCSEACQGVATGLVDATNQRFPLQKNGIYTSEIVRYSEKYRSSQNVVGTVVSMLHSAFGPSQYTDGSDLVELVCKGANHTIPGADDEEQPPDCSNFLNFILRKGGNIVAAAVIRAHGTLLAEVPFVVTREGYRREGNCKRLLSALEKMLNDLGVQWLVVPAVEVTVPIWKDGLGFEEARDDAVEQLEDRIIVPDDSKILLRKVGSLFAPSTTSGKASQKRKRVRFSLPRTAFESTDDSTDDDDDDGNKVKKRGKSSRKKGSDDDDNEFTVDAAEETDDDEEDEEEAGGCRGCSHCGTLSAKQLHENEETGDLLCNSCHIACGGAAAAGAKACYHCGNDDASKLSKHAESGDWECATCRRYRYSHNGELRPARLFSRKVRARAASPAAAVAGGTGSGAAAVSGSTPLAVATPRNYQQQQQNQRTFFLSGGATGNSNDRLAGAQKLVSRLKERVCANSAQLIKHLYVKKAFSDSMKATMLNDYNMNALGSGANQVAIEILAAKQEGEENTAWGDLREQLIESDAARRRAENALHVNTAVQNAVVDEAVGQERQKRAQVEARLEALMKKMKFMEQQQAAIAINTLQNTSNQPAAILAASSPSVPAAAAPTLESLPGEKNASPARSISKDNKVSTMSPFEEKHDAKEDSPLLERSIEDLIQDLGGSPDEDDQEIAGGGGMSLLRVVQKQGMTPLKEFTSNDVGKTTVSSLKEKNTSLSLVKNKRKSVGAAIGDPVPSSASPSPASPRINLEYPRDEEENKMPVEAASEDDHAGEGGLFSLFRSLASSGGGKDGDDTSGDTMMDDNESNGAISNLEEDEEDIMEIEGGVGSGNSAGNVVGAGGGVTKRDSLDLDGPEPFQSQSSKN